MRAFTHIITQGTKLFKGASLLSLAALSLAAAVETQDVREGWFVWPSVEAVKGSALDISWLNAGATGAFARISVKDGHFVTEEGKPLRFWGCNLSAYEALPTAEDARLIARRLSRGGVNIARLHHMDNPWGVRDGGSLWPKDRKEHAELDAGALDRLHYLVSVLKAEGVYSNINLKVSKTLVAEDGFDASVAQVPDFDKRIDMYCRRMIDLQKDYAKRLLTAKNPYTGLSLAEDPAVAVVEMNNENSIMGFWTRDLGRGLDKFPAPFRAELQSLWNTWLTAHYADDAAIKKAWELSAGADGRSLLPASGIWVKKQQKGNASELIPGEDSSSFSMQISEATGIDWHIQASIAPVAIKEGSTYTIEFDAKAEQARRVQVGVSNDIKEGSGQTWRSFGILESVQVGTDWTHVRLVFPAHSVVGEPGSLAMNLGHKSGRVWIKGVRVTEGCTGAGLKAGQSAKAGTVLIPTEASARQWADWIAFLADTERSFAMEMRDYLRKELGLKAPLICTQVDYGALTGLWREKDMEFADSHVYWQHPEFGGTGMWDPKAWSIKNSAQISEFGPQSFAELGSMAMTRVEGKPFTLSEYDHAAPSEFVAEMYPVVASFASRQDWDVVYPFAVGSYGSRNPDGRIDGFFDQLNHPVKWALTPFAALSFRRGLVEPANQSAKLEFGFPYWVEQPHADVQWRRLLPAGIDFLNTRIGISDRPLAAGATARVSLLGERVQGPVSLGKAPQGAVYSVAAPSAAAIVGFIGGADLHAGALGVQCPRFGRDFGAVTAVSLDGRPLADARRVLVTLAARAENQGVTWNATRTSFTGDWGHGPAIAERVPARVTLQVAGVRKVYPLAADGSRLPAVISRYHSGELSFSSLEGAGTLHYEVVAE